ncbi:hypothetical protein [Vibrio rotiferianus]|uniref:hypothetical protein n=1 Tax=Vibrio rotiferianus TaxID=190895 RepID=UPI001586FB52|nr:hypothetical protein [Vibrio rotiferianus]
MWPFLVMPVLVISWEACTQLERRRSTAVGCQESAEQAKLNLNKRRIHLLRLDS